MYYQVLDKERDVMDFKLLSEKELYNFMGGVEDDSAFNGMVQEIKEELEARKTRPKNKYIMEYNGIREEVMAVNFHEAI